MIDTFERFTGRARQVVILAQEEARTAFSDHIGPGHILLGLIREEEGVGARVLTSRGVSTDEIREILGQGDTAPETGQIPFTPRARMDLELALREALSLGHNYIGTEHILLGLTRNGFEISGNGKTFALGETDIRNAVIRYLSSPQRTADLEHGPMDVVGQLRKISQQLADLADSIDPTEES